jgi:hypothetical protein
MVADVYGDLLKVKFFLFFLAKCDELVDVRLVVWLVVFLV